MTTYKLYLIRHGMTAGNREGRFIGRTDLPLCREGVKQLEAYVRDYEYPDVKKVYSSPMQRCVETASILYPNRLLQTVDGLQEYDFGVFEGKTAKQLANRPDFKRFNESGMAAAPEGAEAMTAFAERVAKGFEAIVNDMMTNRITTAAAILHGGVIINLLTVFGYPKREPMLWMTGCGEGYTALIHTHLWQRDKVFEVFSPVPFLREPPEEEYPDDGEDDEDFFRNQPRDYAVFDVEDTPKEEE